MARKYERITNVHLLALIKYLKKVSRDNNARIWAYIAELLSKPRSQRAEVNISKIARLTNEGEYVIIPGKVLGAGQINHRVTVAAYAFSESAKDKIIRAGGRAISIEELIKENPRGSGIKIII